MSDSQQAWDVLWSHARANPDPFEIDEVVPAVASRIGSDEDKARQVVTFLLGEADRLPDGERFFRVEGRAVVPLPEFTEAVSRGVGPIESYPFED